MQIYTLTTPLKLKIQHSYMHAWKALFTLTLSKVKSVNMATPLSLSLWHNCTFPVQRCNNELIKIIISLLYSIIVRLKCMSIVQSFNYPYWVFDKWNTNEKFKFHGVTLWKCYEMDSWGFHSFMKMWWITHDNHVNPMNVYFMHEIVMTLYKTIFWLLFEISWN